MNSFSMRITVGFLSLFQGGALILSRRRLLLISLLPLLFGIVAMVVGVIWGWVHVPQMVSQSLEYIGWFDSNEVWFYLGLILFWPAFLFALVFLVYLAARLVAAPFYSLLAEQTLRLSGKFQFPEHNATERIGVFFRLLIVSLMKTTVLFFFGTVLFVISFIPIFNLLAGLGFYLLLAVDSVDYTLEVMELGFKSRVQFIGRYLVEILGLSLSIILISLVPVLNLFVLPAAVVGGAELVQRLKRKSEV